MEIACHAVDVGQAAFGEGPDVVEAARVGDGRGLATIADGHLGPLGVTMEPGQIVMTGALHASVPVRAGDAFTARFDRLGSVTVRFS